MHAATREIIIRGLFTGAGLLGIAAFLPPALQELLSDGAAVQLAIVTNEFHEYRAQEIAQALGVDAAAVPARTAWWLFPTFYVRELYGILYQWVL